MDLFINQICKYIWVHVEWSLLCSLDCSMLHWYCAWFFWQCGLQCSRLGMILPLPELKLAGCDLIDYLRLFSLRVLQVCIYFRIWYCLMLRIRLLMLLWSVSMGLRLLKEWDWNMIRRSPFNPRTPLRWF